MALAQLILAGSCIAAAAVAWAVRMKPWPTNVIEMKKGAGAGGRA